MCMNVRPLNIIDVSVVCIHMRKAVNDTMLPVASLIVICSARRYVINSY